MTDKQKGVIALLAAATLSGFLGVFSHYINFNIPLFYQTSVRNTLQLTVLIILFLFIGRKKPIAGKDLKWFALRSACGFVNVIGMYIAFTKINIGTTYFLSFAASTICGYILGSLLFKERLGRKNLVALVLAVVGLGFVYSVSFQMSTLGYTIAAIIAGIAAPGWSVFSKQISKTYSNIQMNLVDTAFALIMSASFSLVLREQWVAITWNSIWIAAFLLAFIILGVCILVVYGFRRVDAQAGTLLLLFEVVAGIILGYVFFRQTIPFREAAGGAIILLAIYVRTYSSSNTLTLK